MQKLFGRAALLASVAALAASPAAMASGGKLFGGGATGGGTTTTSGGGGGGGGTGGGGGGGGTSSGGVNDTAPATGPVTACATLPSVTAPVGYWTTFAAVWNDVTVKNCSSLAQIYTVHVTNTNRATGSVDYDTGGAYSLQPGGNISLVFDNDFAPFSTDYDVKVDVSDQSGNLLTTAATTATTPPPN